MFSGHDVEIARLAFHEEKQETLIDFELKQADPKH